MPFTRSTVSRRFFAGDRSTGDLPANTPSGSVARPGAAAGRLGSTTDERVGEAGRFPQHQLAEFLPPRTAASRVAQLPAAAGRPAPGERRGALADLPRDVLHKVGDGLKCRPSMVNLALAAPSMQFALQPVPVGERPDFLKESARSAKDLESIRLVLFSSRSLPGALHAELIANLIASLPDVAKADGSFFRMQAAAAEAAEGFRLLARHIAELPGPQRAALSALLAPHLMRLPVNERFSAMEALLQQAAAHGTHQDRFEMISCLALGMNQFGYRDLPKVAQVLVDAAAALPLEDRQRLEERFRAGMACKMLDGDRQYVEQLVAGLPRVAGSSP
jgi:hypothetical protein